MAQGQIIAQEHRKLTAMNQNFKIAKVLSTVVAATLIFLSFSPANAEEATTSKGCSAGISKTHIALFGKPPPYEHCCVRHDREYGRLGTMDQRAQADRRLSACVIGAGHPGMGILMLIGVQVGGQSRYAFDWHQIDHDYPMKNWYAR